MIDQLLDIIWPSGVPERLDRIVDRPLCASLLRDFKLGFILSVDTQSTASEPRLRPTRMALSDQREPTPWQQAVGHQWPSAEAARFLNQVGAGSRRMVDSDGSTTAVLYLDDLQATSHELVPPGDLATLELMCATLTLPGEQRGWLTRHAEPPLKWLDGPLRERTHALLDLGAVGLWALRWSGAEVEAVLWITESRWRGNADTAQAAVMALLKQNQAPPVATETLATLQACLAPLGHRIYPDAVELSPRGVIDLTIGFL